MKVILVAESESDLDMLEHDRKYLERELGELIGGCRPIAYRHCQIELSIELIGFVLGEGSST